jgi:metal-dependent amidase/aminoacylase/carboxypeptidase family protein
VRSVELNGTESPNLHHPSYDFNDELLPYGAAFWVELVRRRLPVEGS